MERRDYTYLQNYQQNNHGRGYFVDNFGDMYSHAVPFDPRTGKEIIDLEGGLADE